MLKVTYRCNRWPEGKTSVWMAKSQEWIDWISLIWADTLTILSVETA